MRFEARRELADLEEKGKFFLGFVGGCLGKRWRSRMDNALVRGATIIDPGKSVEDLPSNSIVDFSVFSP